MNDYGTRRRYAIFRPTDPVPTIKHLGQLGDLEVFEGKEIEEPGRLEVDFLSRTIELPPGKWDLEAVLNAMHTISCDIDDFLGMQ